MLPKTLALLDRRLARIQKEHGWRLASVLEESLRVIKVNQRASTGQSYEQFKQATASAQSEYGTKLHAEIFSIIEQTQHSLSADGKAEILKLVPKYLNEDLYMTRLRIYEEAVVRHVGRFGMKLDLTTFRPDLVKSLYHVGSSNFVRSVIDKLTDDLELVVQRRSIPLSSQPPAPESKLEQANRLIKLEPNFLGIGLNLNYLIRRWFGRKE